MEKDESLYMRFCTQNSDEGYESAAPNEWFYLKPLRQDGNTVGVSICVHGSAHQKILELFSLDCRLIKTPMEKKEGIQFLSPKDSEEWGLGSVCKTVPIDEDWTEYRVNYSLNPYVISQTVEIVLEILTYHCEIEPPGKIRQLAVIQGMGQGGSHMSGYGLYVSISPGFRSWVELLVNSSDSDKVAEIRESMKNAFDSLDQKYKPNLDEFTMWLRKDRFGLAVPGNCACFGVSGNQGSIYSKGRCYEVSAHNMDNAYQQLSILAGFAHMWEFARDFALLNQSV